MKHNRIAQVACLAIIIAGVFFTTSHAQATVVLPHSGSTGCSAPVGGAAIGPCGNVEPHGTAAKTPKKHWHRHWHRHWHFRFHFHYRGHHTYHYHHHHH